jgi:hypothetical protein
MSISAFDILSIGGEDLLVPGTKLEALGNS